MKKHIKKNIKNREAQLKEQYTKDHAQEIQKSSMVKQFGIILIAVVVMIGGGMGFYSLFLDDTPTTTTKDPNPSEDKEVFDEEYILAGESFNRKDGNYMVLYTNESCGTACTALTTIVNNYEDAVENYVPTYKVDMDNGFNKGYLYDWEQHKEEFGDEDKDARINKELTSVTDLKIASFPTLIVFENNKVVQYLEKDEVKEYLDSLVPETEE